MSGEDKTGGQSDVAALLLDAPSRGLLVLKKTLRSVTEHRVSFNAAAAAFYLLLAIIPGLAGIVLIYGFVADPADVRSMIDMAEGAVPAEVIAVMEHEVQRIANAKVSGWAFFVGLGFAIWSGQNAMGALITGLNIAHTARDRRRFFPKLMVSVTLAVGGLLFFVAVVGLLAVIPLVLEFVGYEGYAGDLVSAARWPALVLVMMLWLSLLYRWAPDQKGVRWEWMTWGSLVASLLWIAGSALFTAWVAKFGRYSAVYGSLGAVVVTMIWLYFSAFVVLLGEELNVEVARQKRLRERSKRQKRPPVEGI